MLWQTAAFGRPTLCLLFLFGFVVGGCVSSRSPEATAEDRRDVVGVWEYRTQGTGALQRGTLRIAVVDGRLVGRLRDSWRGELRARVRVHGNHLELNLDGLRISGRVRRGAFQGSIRRAFDESQRLLVANDAGDGTATEPYDALERALHQTIAKMTDDLAERFQFNTAIAALMECTNAWTQTIHKQAPATLGDIAVLETVMSILPRLLAPFAPHLAEELWAALGCKDFVSTAAWPKADADKLVADRIELPIQVNGKLRGKVLVAPEAAKDEILAAAKTAPGVQKYLQEGDIKREILVPGRLVNFVVQQG